MDQISIDKDLSHLVPGVYQTFGKRAFFLFLFEWLSFPTALLICSFLVSIARRIGFIPVELQGKVAVASYIMLFFSILAFIISIIISRFVYKSRGFSLSDDALKIKQGIFTKQEKAIPYRQIQNVQLERTLSQQIFGVSKLVIVTAGADDVKTDFNESKGVIPTIDKELATALQEELIRRSDVQRVVRMV